MLSPSLSVRDFIATVQKRAAEDIYHLNLSSNETEINTIEVVEAGQELENIKAEDAPKMEPEDITMRQKYGSALAHVSFYVRSYSPCATFFIRIRVILFFLVIRPHIL
jgi:hypothetical protein